MDAYYIDASVAPYYYAKPPQAAMTAPHLISQRRMQELVAPESSSSSSAPSSSSSSSPVSSLPTVLTVSEIEEKLASALIACRAALHVSEENALESEVSSDDGSDEDMDDDDDEFSSEDDSMLDADEDDVDDDDDEEEEEELAPVRRDDTYEQRIRRVSAWRAAVAAEAPAALAPASPALSRKRKADGDCETAQSACVKRARIALDALPATCAACGGAFPSALALQLHGLPMNPSEACRAAVAYQLEA